MAIVQKQSSGQKSKFAAMFVKFDEFELKLCISINQWGQKPKIKQFFRTISRLGDGIFWYSLLIIFTLQNSLKNPSVESLSSTALIAIISISCVVVYKTIKSVMVRERPFIAYGEITAYTAPLDQYSFPSGHSMNAACFTVLFSYFEPMLALIALPFAILVAMSRVILGVHFISDVIVGIFLGCSIAWLGISLC